MDSFLEVPFDKIDGARCCLTASGASRLGMCDEVVSIIARQENGCGDVEALVEEVLDSLDISDIEPALWCAMTAEGYPVWAHFISIHKYKERSSTAYSAEEKRDIIRFVKACVIRAARDGVVF